MPKPKRNESKQDYLKRCTGELIDKEGRKPEQAYAVCNRYWDEAQGKRAGLSLRAPLELQAAGSDDSGDKPRPFMITAYSGEPVETSFGPLVIDVQGITAEQHMPVLREHMRDRVAGSSAKSWVDKSNFYISGELSRATADGREVEQLADEGFPWQASVGVWPKKIKVLESEEEAETVNGQEIRGPAEIWRQSFVREVSFVALGADGNTAAVVLNEQDADRVPVEIEGRVDPGKQKTSTGGQIMDITLQQLEKDAPQLLEQVRREAREAGAGEATEAERNRVIEILDAGGEPEPTVAAIKDGLSVDQAYKQFFQAEKQKRREMLDSLENNAPGPVGSEPPPNDPPVGEDERSGDQKLADAARELAQKEGVSISAALQRVARSQPELAREGLPRLAA